MRSGEERFEGKWGVIFGGSGAIIALGGEGEIWAVGSTLHVWQLAGAEEQAAGKHGTFYFLLFSFHK